MLGTYSLLLPTKNRYAFDVCALQESVMAAEAQHTCYEGDSVRMFRFYLEHSGEHKAVVRCVNSVLAGEFKRYSRK